MLQDFQFNITMTILVGFQLHLTTFGNFFLRLHTLNLSPSTLDDWRCQLNPVAFRLTQPPVNSFPTSNRLPRPPLPALDSPDKYSDPNTDLTWRSTTETEPTACSDLWNFAGYGRNIRPLPCVSKGGETGVCMFAWDCMKANGTHLGTCIDRWVSIVGNFK